MEGRIRIRRGTLLVASLAVALAIAAGALGATGDLTFAQCFDDEDTNLEGAACANAPGLGGAASVAVSRDGRSVYAASRLDDAIVNFRRDPATGALTFVECFEDQDSGTEMTLCGDVPGLESANALAVSADGESLYAVGQADDAIVDFNRADDGTLEFWQCRQDRADHMDPDHLGCEDTLALNGPTDVVVSEDGTSVYVASRSDDAVRALARDPATGDLGLAQCFDDDDSNIPEDTFCTDAPGLDTVSGVAVSADGDSLYVSAASNQAIVNFSRDTTGAVPILAFAECFDDEDSNLEGAACAPAPGLGGAASVTLSSDGRSVYGASAADDAIFSFNRATTGLLTFAQCFDDQDTGLEGATCADVPGLDAAASVATSPDRRSLYVASEVEDAIVNFNRALGDGSLTFSGCLQDKAGHPDPDEAACTNAVALDEASWVATSPEGRSVYAAASSNGAIVNFNRELPAAGGGAVVSNAFTIGRVKGRTLSVDVLAAGIVEVADAGASASRGASAAARRRLKPSSASGGPGTIEVKLKLTKPAKTKLRAKGKVEVRARITFTPTGGTANSQTAKLKIRRK